MNWREFRPTIFFLGKFLGIYLAGNLLYGWFITAYYPEPDPVTIAVTRHSAGILDLFTPAHPVVHMTKPTVSIYGTDRSVVSVYEGCSGLNVAIIYMAFLVAFGPLSMRLLWFAPLGLVIIHIANLLRIVLLFVVASRLPGYLYFTHKYLFTAFIYIVVFILWFVWVRMHKPKTQERIA